MKLIELEQKNKSFADYYGENRPVFSAYECGKLATPAKSLEEDGKFFYIDNEMRFQTLYEEYMNNTELDFLPVFDTSNEIIGYTMRQKLLAALSKGPFSKELLLRPEVTVQSIYDKRVLCIDAYANLSETSYLLMQREEDIRFDPFIITIDGFFYGVCSIQKVLDGLNRFLEKDMSFCEDSQLKLSLETNKNFAQESNLSIESSVICLHGPGGDYVGTFSLNENLSLFIHLDVCGKGLKASNVVMVLGSIFKTWIEMEKQNDIANFRLADRLREINKLAYDLTPEEMYATGVFILHDKTKQTIEVFDYGHGFIWLKRKDALARLSDYVVETELDKMPFFGINETLDLKSVKVKVKPGDFVTNNIEKVLKSFTGKNPSELNKLIMTEWEDFRKEYRIMDDYSLLTIGI